jgi:LmbE family N-acetylglucosaminyl deacetylase
MANVYILAHFDDEYCAAPLIWQAREAGLEQRFLYIADYRSPAIAERRGAESRAFLAAQGLDPASAVHVGRGTGGYDGGVHRALPAAYGALQLALQEVAVDRLIVPAWEGGHMDHDMCALMAVRLAQARGGPPVDQFSLYNGPRLPGPLLRGCAPLPQNGPVTRVPLTGAQLRRWMTDVRHFPSQYFAWSGIWPAMFAGYARRGFGHQRLDPGRVEARPHAGPLFYERMFGVPYDEVRAAADAALPGAFAG